jgi:hypothetical protein
MHPGIISAAASSGGMTSQLRTRFLDIVVTSVHTSADTTRRWARIPAGPPDALDRSEAASPRCRTAQDAGCARVERLQDAVAPGGPSRCSHAVNQPPI